MMIEESKPSISSSFEQLLFGTHSGHSPRHSPFTSHSNRCFKLQKKRQKNSKYFDRIRPSSKLLTCGQLCFETNRYKTLSHDLARPAPSHLFVESRFCHSRWSGICRALLSCTSRQRKPPQGSSPWWCWWSPSTRNNHFSFLNHSPIELDLCLDCRKNNSQTHRPVESIGSSWFEVYSFYQQKNKKLSIHGHD